MYSKSGKVFLSKILDWKTLITLAGRWVSYWIGEWVADDANKREILELEGLRCSSID